VQSAELASFDAWIKYYRPDENSANVSVSYYTKGAVVAFLLDVKIRNATSGARSLDDVMRTAYQKYAGPRGFTPDEFRQVAESVAGTSLRAFWDGAISGISELDYNDALDTLGLRFRPARRPRVARDDHTDRCRPAACLAAPPRHARDVGGTQCRRRDPRD